MVSVFFRDVTPEEFTVFLSAIKYEHYRNVTDHVLAEQPGSETFLRQSVPLFCEPFVREFLELDDRSVAAAEDHQDLALAA